MPFIDTHASTASSEGKLLFTVRGKGLKGSFFPTSLRFSSGHWSYFLIVAICTRDQRICHRQRDLALHFRLPPFGMCLSCSAPRCAAPPAPLVLQVMFGLFCGITLAWTYLCVRSRREAVQRIHWLMLALVVCKTFTLLAQACMYLVIERYGSPYGWNWVYYFATFFRGMLFFTVVVLIGTGW